MGIRFEINDSGRPQYIIDDPRWAMLGSWLTSDVHGDHQSALDALAMIDDVVSGRSVREVYEGVVYDVDIRRIGVQVCHSRSGEHQREYTLDDVRVGVERYWVFMRVLPTGRTGPDTELRLWEATTQRPHPYRGRLGLPEDDTA